MEYFIESGLWVQIAIPMAIFLARVADVSMQTVRIIFVSRGIRLLAAIIGFFEILIWLVAITQIMQNLTNVFNYLAYASGFAIGNYLGIVIEDKISIGITMIRIITQKDATKLIEFLKGKGCGVTSVDAQGARGPVKIVFTVIERKNTQGILKEVTRFNPNAFYTVEDMRNVSENYISSVNTRMGKNSIRNLFLQKKK